MDSLRHTEAIMVQAAALRAGVQYFGFVRDHPLTDGLRFRVEDPDGRLPGAVKALADKLRDLRRAVESGSTETRDEEVKES